jgi:hypothetical protein
METTNFLSDTYDPESFIFSTPKKLKNADVMIGKIKNKDSDPILVQFPKMLVTDYTKFVELEFINETGYNKKVFNFLSKLDDFIVKHIHDKSSGWFGKTIPLENVTHMYNKFIKAPKTSDNKCTINFVFDTSKSELIDKKNEPLDTSEITKGVTLECISQMKYIVFTKDSCFVNWEICTAKLHKKIQRVPKFGFIEDPSDNNNSENESEEENITTFF